MQSKAKTVEQYLSELPQDRKKVISKIRQVIVENLNDGYKEVMQYGMVSYVVPFDRYSDTYNKKPLAYISLASQKNYISLYLINVYMDQETNKWFQDEYQKSGKKLNMGKSCVRFRTIDDLPLELIARVVKRNTVDEFVKSCKNVRKR